MRLSEVMHNEFTSVCNRVGVRPVERYVLGYVSPVCDSERSEVVRSRITGGDELCVDAVGLKSPPYIGRKKFCLVPLDKSECLLYSISAVLVNKFR